MEILGRERTVARLDHAIASRCAGRRPRASVQPLPRCRTRLALPRRRGDGADAPADGAQGPLPDRGVPGARAGALVLLPAHVARARPRRARAPEEDARRAASYNYRPAVLFVITALVLTLQEYYGGRDFYEEHIEARPPRRRGRPAPAPGGPRSAASTSTSTTSSTATAGGRSRASFGYTVDARSPLWKIFFRKDSSSTWACASRGLLKHAWIYALCLAVVLPAVLHRLPRAGLRQLLPVLQARLALAGSTLACWEAMYFAQFFALEMFFRGFWLSGLRNTPRLGGHLRHVRAVLHDPLRQAVPRGGRRRRRRASRSARWPCGRRASTRASWST